MDNTYEQSILAASPEAAPMSPMPPSPPAGPFLRNVGLRYGVIAGLFMVAWQLVLYVIDWKLTAGFWGSISLVPWIAILYFGAVEARKSLGGHINFVQVLAVVLIIVLVSSLLGVAYNYIQNTFIDPELPAKLKELTIETTEEKLTSMGMDEDKIEEQLKNLRDADFKPSLKNLSIYMAGSVVLGLVIGLIIGLIVQRKKPLFADAR